MSTRRFESDSGLPFRLISAGYGRNRIVRFRTAVLPDRSFAVSVIVALTVLPSFRARYTAASDLRESLGDSFIGRFAWTILVIGLKRWLEALSGTVILPVAVTSEIREFLHPGEHASGDAERPLRRQVGLMTITTTTALTRSRFSRPTIGTQLRPGGGGIPCSIAATARPARGER